MNLINKIKLFSILNTYLLSNTNLELQEIGPRYTTVRTEHKNTNSFMLSFRLHDFSNDNEYIEFKSFLREISNITKIKYEDIFDIINDNYTNISCFYSSYKACYTDILFDYASNNGLLSNYCSDDLIEIKNLSRDEQEYIILKFCEWFNLNDDEKKIMLAIFRWETGHGESYLCQECNNYGGIRVSNGEFGRFQTVEYGIYCFCRCVIGHLNRCYTNTNYTDIYDILSYISNSYCPSTSEDWTNSVFSMTSDITIKENSKVKKYEN